VLAEQVPLRAPACDFALLLSGGLDSSVLAYLLRPPVCVTVRYPGQERLDESVIASRIAVDIGAELPELVPTTGRRNAYGPACTPPGQPAAHPSALSSSTSCSRTSRSDPAEVNRRIRAHG
jgi:hypothetical protein